MIKDLLFALELGFKIISTFILSIYFGIRMDDYFNLDCQCLLIMIFIAFFIVMKTLLGVIKHE